MGCYSKEELDMFRHGEMSVLSRICCKAHLKECEACQQRLAKLHEDDLLTEELQQSVKAYESFNNSCKKKHCQAYNK